MRKDWSDDGWRWRFAFFPVTLQDGPNYTRIWWEWYRARDRAGEYTEIEFSKEKTDD